MSVARRAAGRPTTGLDAAYRECARITRRAAGNLSYVIGLLPAPQRRGLCAVYATARRIDDISDSAAPAARRTALLMQARAALHRLPYTGADPVLTALADTAQRLPIPLDAFDDLIDGCLADAQGRRYASFEDLVGYCRRVGGSIGRLSLGVVSPAPRRSVSDVDSASGAAESLGVALALTHILRNLAGDLANGRVYLPSDDLAEFGCTLELRDDGSFTDPPDQLAALLRHEADRADAWYPDGLRLLPLLDRRSAAGTAAMAGVYRRLLARVRADPLAVTRTRPSLPGRQKAYVAARALLWGGV